MVGVGHRWEWVSNVSDLIEDDDDGYFYANFDVPDAVLSRVSG